MSIRWIITLKTNALCVFRSDEGGSYQGSSTEELIGSQSSDKMSVESYDQQMDDNLSIHSCDETDGLITGVNTPEIGSPERSEIDPPKNTYPMHILR